MSHEKERLSWRADGPAEGPVLVLVHGLCESLRCWDLVMPILAEGHRIVRADLLGFGDSPQAQEGYEIEEQAKALIETPALDGVEGATLVGHSMGGSVSSRPRRLVPGWPDRWC